MSDPKDICSKEEVREELERFNKLRDANLENKLLVQKHEIVREVQDAIGKIPNPENSPTLNRRFDLQDRKLLELDKKLDDNETAHRLFSKQEDKTQAELEVVKESLKPIDKIVWGVVMTMILGIVGAVISFVKYK